MSGSAGALAARLVADTSNFRAEMTSAANLTEKEMKRAAKATQFVNDYLKETAKLQKEVGSSSASVQQSAEHMERLGFHTASAKRELLVLAHELSQGNFKKFGGSLLVLGEQTGAASLLFSGLGIAALAASGVILGFVGAVVKGHLETDAFNKSLMLTGNFAGVTAGEMDRLARSTSALTGRSLGASREALQGLISTGQFGPQTLGAAAVAVVALEKATGQSSEEIIKDFSKMDDGVAKWAAEHNKSFNFITGDQYAYIKRLEEQGQKEQAEVETLKLLNNHLGVQMPQNLGFLERAWKSMGDTASETWDSMKGVGRAGTVEDEISKQLNRLDAVRQAANAKPLLGSSGLPKFNSSEAEIRVIDDLRLAKIAKLAQEESALAAAEAARLEKARIVAVDAIDKIREETKGTTLATREIEKYRKQVELLKGTKSAVSEAEQKAAEAAIRKKYDPVSVHADNQLTRDVAERMRSLGEESARLDDEIASWEKYGRAVDKSRVAVTLFDIAQGKLKGASMADKGRLLAAAEDDNKEAILRSVEANKKLQKQLTDNEIKTTEFVAQLDAETESLGKTSIEAKVAAENLRLFAEAQKLANTPGSDETAIVLSMRKQQKEREDGLRRNYAAQRTFAYGARQAFASFQEDATNEAKNAATLINGTINQLNDAIINFAKTGKLSFHDLFGYMAEEFLRQQLRMGESKLIGSLDWGSLFGLGGSSGTTAGDIAGNDIAQGYANGLSYVPYDGFPAVLHEGERVMTRQENQNGGSGGTVVDGSIGTLNVGQGVSRGEMLAAVRQGMAEVRANIQRSTRQGTF